MTMGFWRTKNFSFRFIRFNFRKVKIELRSRLGFCELHLVIRILIGYINSWTLIEYDFTQSLTFPIFKLWGWNWSFYVYYGLFHYDIEVVWLCWDWSFKVFLRCYSPVYTIKFRLDLWLFSSRRVHFNRRHTCCSNSKNIRFLNWSWGYTWSVDSIELLLNPWWRHPRSWRYQTWSTDAIQVLFYFSPGCLVNLLKFNWSRWNWTIDFIKLIFRGLGADWPVW